MAESFPGSRQPEERAGMNGCRKAAKTCSFCFIMTTGINILSRSRRMLHGIGQVILHGARHIFHFILLSLPLQPDQVIVPVPLENRTAEAIQAAPSAIGEEVKIG